MYQLISFPMNSTKSVIKEKKVKRQISHYQGLYSKTCLKQPLKKKTKNWFSIPIIPKCRSKVLQIALLEHSAILSTFIKPPFVFKTFVLAIFEWPLKTGFTVHNRGAMICQKAYCNILRYGKPVLRYTWYLYFCLLLPLVQYYNIFQGS